MKRKDEIAFYGFIKENCQKNAQLIFCVVEKNFLKER
jgi:hypothetical protein